MSFAVCRVKVTFVHCELVNPKVYFLVARWTIELYLRFLNTRLTLIPRLMPNKMVFMTFRTLDCVS
jgi:hypothetical protein